ncbi:uncharacterized protein LOC144903080 isoform X1 [Branchiostoma floridae x Branchiostoma belcheri]
MSNKARRMLVLLLIILKEAGLTAACSSRCSWTWTCVCNRMDLTSVPQDLPTDITGLYLERNTITTLNQSDFSRYRSLRTLRLGSNQISTIHNNTFYSLTSLTGLDLNDNRLTTLPADIFEGLGNLQYLYLNNNQLTSLPAGIFEGLGNLQDLYLYNSQLTSLTADIFVGLGNLETLDLYNNNIHSIEAGTFNDTTQLRHLELQNNNISTITADTLGNLLQLQTLRLSHNNISTFPVEALSNLNMLLSLTLDNNQLETLPVMAYDILASISDVNIDNNPWYNPDPDVNIDNNPWQCDCRMVPFKQRMSGSYPFENQIRCAGPANLTGRYLRDVNPEDLRDVTLNPEDLICEETTPFYSTSSTKHMVDSTDPPFPSTVTLTPTLSLTESNTGPGDGGIVLSVPLLATVCIFLGISITCTTFGIAFAVWCMYKRRQRDPTPQQGFSNTNPTGTSSGHEQIRLQAVGTSAGIISQSETSHPDTEESQLMYNLPTDEDPDTAEYDTIDEVNQSESPHQDAGNTQSLDSFKLVI